MRLRFLARQFARPGGLIGRWLIAPWLDRISREQNSLVLERLAIAPGDRVLEVGFGGGGLLAMMLARDARDLIGVDPSEAALARARRRFRGKELQLLAGTVEALPLPAAGADKAASVNSLYFWEDLPAALVEIGRVLRPGGTLVLGWESPEMLRKWPGYRYGFHVRTADEVIAAAAGAGFGEPKPETVNGFHLLSLRRRADMEAP
jgi:ubiquinone/menaquinone biosynthesis C-methylase UbiE